MFMSKRNRQTRKNYRGSINPDFPTGLHQLGIGRNQYIDLMNQSRSKVALLPSCVPLYCMYCGYPLDSHRWVPLTSTGRSGPVPQASQPQAAAASTRHPPVTPGALVGGARWLCVGGGHQG